jgi:hypothetical protein
VTGGSAGTTVLATLPAPEEPVGADVREQVRA